MGGSSDPFVTCKVGDKSRTSHVERSTLNPKWDEKLHFTGTLQEMIPHGCLLSLYDHDRNTTNESLGEFEVDLEALAHHDVLEFRAAPPPTPTPTRSCRRRSRRLRPTSSPQSSSSTCRRRAR